MRVEIVYVPFSFLSRHTSRGYDVYEDNAEVFSLKEDGYCSTVWFSMGARLRKISRVRWENDEEVNCFSETRIVPSYKLFQLFKYRFRVSTADLSIRSRKSRLTKE